MKTIIQVVQHLRPGGIESLALDLLAFADKNENSLIISLEGELESAIAHWPKLDQYREQLIFVNKQSGLSPSVLLTLIKIFKQKQVDTIHTHHIGPLLYAGLAARLSKVKHLIHTEHDAWHLNDNKRCKIQRHAIKFLKPILVADANIVANIMQQRLQCDNNINVIYNGINTDYFIPGNRDIAREQLNLPLDVKIIGCAGRMEKVKGQSVLINALKELPEHVHIAFAGNGSFEAKLREQVIELNLEQRVHFLGHIEKMPTFYQALDLFCLPSLNEGFPLSPLEAQACNIKALVTNVGASKETLCPKSGQYISPNNVYGMAFTLNIMLMIHTKSTPRNFVKKYANIKKMVTAYADLRQVSVPMPIPMPMPMPMPMRGKL